MYTYKNDNNEKVYVTEEHLDMAVKIKKELQKSSPSHKCSWGVHKKMMEQEGFYDSGKNESYRCLVKYYQKSIDELPSTQKYADMVSTSKLKSIKSAVGELFYTKKEVQTENRKLNKLKNELTLYGVIAEEIAEAFKDVEELIPIKVYEDRVEDTGNKALMGLSDWHIGALIRGTMGNEYNYEIAKNRIELYTKKFIHDARQRNVSDVHVALIGDITEHIQMRKTQGHNVEFPLGQQINKAYTLIRNLLCTLALNGFNVTYSGISGNHDRLEGKKEDNHDGDSTVVVINDRIKEFIDSTDADRIKYHESDELLYSTVLEMNGKKIKIVHGDNERGNNIIGQHDKLDGCSYDVIIMGHLHHFSVKEVGFDKWEAIFGSTQGSNAYGKVGKFVSTASQGTMFIYNDGEVEFKNYRLQTNATKGGE